MKPANVMRAAKTGYAGRSMADPKAKHEIPAIAKMIPNILSVVFVPVVILFLFLMFDIFPRLKAVLNAFAALLPVNFY